MILPFALIVAISAASAVSPSLDSVPLRLAEVIVRSHVVIRVETSVATPNPPLASLFSEKKGPSCIDMGNVAGAGVIAPNSVDLALKTGKRVRAHFAGSCPGLDYYSGFYIAPTRDAKFCAGRDAIRDRAGGECTVTRFKEVVPRK